jgi:hypothetical protein
MEHAREKESAQEERLKGRAEQEDDILANLSKVNC